MVEIRLDGRGALITGGSKGLGRAMAKRMGEAGAKVAIAARDQASLDEAKAEVEAAGGRCFPFVADVTDPERCKSLYADAVSALGQVDILVNNAGHSTRGPFESITDEVWREDLELKLFAQIRLSRLAFPDMKGRRWGRIINVLNTGAKAPGPEMAPTAVTRAAGMALSKVMAGEGAPHNVLVNSLCTGLIDSDQHRRRWEREGRKGTYEEFLAELGKNLPMGRYGTSQEFADMALFLASDLAGYITGTAINVDGGRCPVV